MASGTTNLSHYNLLSGRKLPDQIIVGMMTETAYRGAMNKNPYNFSHFNCIEASLIVNGVHEPLERHSFDISTGDYITLYSDFLENTGVSTDDRDIFIQPKDFIGGNFLLCYDRGKDKCNRFHRHHTDSGTIDINLRVKSNINETVVVIVYCTYSSELLIDERGNVTLESF